MAEVLYTDADGRRYAERTYKSVSAKPVPREIIERAPLSRYDIALGRTEKWRTRRASTPEEIDAWILMNSDKVSDQEYGDAWKRAHNRSAYAAADTQMAAQYERAWRSAGGWAASDTRTDEGSVT